MKRSNDDLCNRISKCPKKTRYSVATSVRSTIREEIRAFFKFNPVNRLWHSPLLAALCLTFPLLLGYFIGKMQIAGLGSFGALVIMHYSPISSIGKRMRILILCSLGMVASFILGLFCASNIWLAISFLLVFSFLVHIIVKSVRLKPPGNFFFITIATIGCCQPYHFDTILPKAVILIAGTSFACLVAFVYSLIMLRKGELKPFPAVAEVKPDPFGKYIEGAIIGFFIALSLLCGYLLGVKNPYWIPISCLAVIQGISRHHIWERSFHRVIGTFFGVGLCYLLLKIHSSALIICMMVFILQFVMEIVGGRHYALAAVFATPMTILLAEVGNPELAHPDHLALVRLLDTLIGSGIGAIAGYLIYHEKLRQAAVNSIRKTRIIIRRH